MRNANLVAKWMVDHPKKARGYHTLDWTYGTFYQGLVSLAIADPEGPYLDHIRKVGQDFKWGFKGRLYNADDYCIGQTWVEMAMQDCNPNYVKAIQRGYAHIMAHPNTTCLDVRKNRFQRWCWCDSLFMSPTTLVRLGGYTGNLDYWRFMDREYKASYDYLYDKKLHFFYRDSSYFKARCKNGKPVFWSRGEGWVYGGLTVIIRDLPDNWPSKKLYIKIFQEMSEAIMKSQCPDGAWHPSMLDPSDPDRQEMSGSSFFTYGLFWGLNNHLLDRKVYLPVAKKAWSAICRNINDKGLLGWSQPVAGNPHDGKSYGPDSYEVYAVGAYLRAAMELRKLVAAEAHPDRVTVTVENPVAQFRHSETIEIPWPQAGLKAEDLRVFDFRTSAVLPHQLYDSNGDGTPDRLLFRTPVMALQKRIFWLFNGNDLPAASTRTRCKSRYVPERLDDFAWENDKIMNRVYGPAVSQPRPKGEGLFSSGIDVWCKRVPGLMFDKWYKRGNYHHNYGEGMDGYKTGNGCGCGGFGVMRADRWYSAVNWRSQKNLCDGPVRTAFTLSYAEWPCGNGVTLKEERRTTLDAGSHLTRYESLFTVKGAPFVMGGPGLDTDAKRHHNGVIAFGPKRNWIANFEPRQGANGSLATAVVFPGGEKTAIDTQNGIHLLKPIRNGQKVVWYSGSAWSQTGAFTQAEDWHRLVEAFAEGLAHPLKVTVR